MKATLHGRLCALGLFVGIIAAAQVVSAQSFSFPVGGFTTTNVCANSATPPSSCQVLTNGSPNHPAVVGSGILQLTPANQNQHGSAWFNLQQPLSTGFTTAFQFQISNTNACFGCTFPADGMALVIQNDPAGTGALGYTGDGQNMSYGNNDVSTASGPGNAILNSLAIELDTFQNTNYSDPNGNHIAVQSCGPNNATTLTPNSADHNYACPNGSLANLALQSLPSGLSLSDGNIHTITVNYLPPGTCTNGCNNLSVYMDSTLILQATLNIAQQLNLTANGSAYLGFTAATGSLVQNNDILSWSFSSLPLAPITINQPLQTTTTNFNFTPTLSAIANYSQSGLNSSAFTGVVMQGSVQTITDDGPGSQFYNLVYNTPFQGTSCQHQDVGTGNFYCVVTTDLCTTSTNSTPSGANCPNTGTNALIIVSNTYNLDPTQKPILTSPGYIMGTDTALSCGSTPPLPGNSCQGLINIFTGISGDSVSSSGGTKNFNSLLIPIFGVVHPNTSVSTTPVLNGGWTNGPVTLNFNSIDAVPSNNNFPPATLPTVVSIAYSVAGANVPSPASGTVTGSTGSINIPGAVQGATVVTYAGTDNAGTVETDVTYNSGGNMLSSASPTFTINVDLTAPTISALTISPPSPTFGQAVTASYSCADAVSGVVLCGPLGSPNIGPIIGSTGTLTSPVNSSGGTHTATIIAQSLAGNQSTSSVSYTVAQATPTVTFTGAPASAAYGSTFTVATTTNASTTAVITAAGACSNSGNSITMTSGTGTCSLTATWAADSNYAAASANQSTAATLVASTITWATPSPIVYGTQLSSAQLDATASVPGTFVYTPAAGTVLPAGNQTLSTAFTPASPLNYASATAQVTLLVTQPSIGLSPTSLNFGTVGLGKLAFLTETVSNPSSSSLKITGVSLKLGTGSDWEEFAFLSFCGPSLPPGKSCYILVSFFADTLGTHDATLLVTDSAAGSPQQIPITATVVKGH
jgi:hypothetical protein